MNGQIDIKGKKTFWQRPEGIPGALFLAGILGFLGYGLYQIMPQLIRFAENVYYLGAMVGGAFAIGYVLFSKRFRTLMWYFYKNFMRKLTGLIIEMDPIAIIQGYLEDLREKSIKMEDQIAKLKGQISTLKKKIDKKGEEIDYFFRIAQQAKKSGDEGTSRVNAKKATRVQKTKESFSVLLSKTEKLYKILSKMKKYSDLMSEDIAHEVEVKTEEREIIRTSHGVMKSAVSIINGNSDKKLIFDQAMEYIVDDIGMRIGEMERFMDVSADFMNNMDLENAMYEEQGMQALDDWANKIDQKFDDSNYQTVSDIESRIKSLGAIESPKAQPQPIKVQNTNTSSNSNSNSNSSSKYF